MATLSRSGTYGEIVADRNFRGLWLGQSLFYLGQAMAYVAVALYVYQLTGSARELSFAVALQLLPFVVVGPLAGLLADYLERRGVLVAAYLFQAALVGLLPFTTSVGQVYLLVFASNLLTPVAEIVRGAALPAVTGPRLIVQGSSLSIVSYNVVHVVGPLLGGGLVSLVGAQPTFFVVVGCLIAAALLTLSARIPQPAREEGLDRPRPAQLWHDLRQGLRSLFGTPVLRYLVLLNCFSALGWSAPDLAMVVYVTDHLQRGGGSYGLLRATLPLSTALGVLLLGRRPHIVPRQYLLAGGLIVAALAYFPILAQPGFVLLLAMWLVSGIGWAANWLTDESLWAQATAEAVRGRVYSLALAIVTLFETGMALLGGWLIQRWGPANALAAMGGMIIGGAILVSALSGGPQAVAHFDRREGDRRRSPE